MISEDFCKVEDDDYHGLSHGLEVGLLCVVYCQVLGIPPAPVFLSALCHDLERYEKNNLSNALSDPLVVKVVNENTFERVETVSYFNKRFRKERDPEYNFVALPDSSQFNCPLTNEPYIIEISPNSVRVSSPIRSYRDNRYGFFALKTRSHGYIIDGTRSWDN